MKNILMAGLAFVMPLLGKDTHVLVFAGSTRAASVNKKLAQEAAGVAQEMGAKVTVIDLKDYPMPLYDGDLEEMKGMPKNAKKLRNLMMASQIIVIASPEYNGSLSAVLKNGIDWASRSEEGGSSSDAFKDKKFAIMSASPGRGGGSRGLAHLRAIIENMGSQVVEKQVTVSNAYQEGAFDHVKESLREELNEAMVDAVHS